MSMHSFLLSFPLSTQSYTLCILFVLTPHHLPENEPIFLNRRHFAKTHPTE